MAKADLPETAAPQSHDFLFGHADAVATFEEAARSGHLHHAWLITGPEGIGKATLAFRLIRYLLAGEFDEHGVLDLTMDSSVARKIAGRSHANLLVLERAMDEKTKRLKTGITIDVVRRTVGFFGATAGEGGWRAALVDPADEMNDAAANALLKILEEPPDKSVFFLISNRPGGLLPTIRSRCRVLTLQPLSDQAVEASLSALFGTSFDANRLAEAARLSGGSVGRAARLLTEGGLDLADRLYGLLDSPSPNWRSVHEFCGSLAGRDAERSLAMVRFLWEARLSQQLHGAARAYPVSTQGPAILANFHAHMVTKFDEALGLNLDKKQLMLGLFERYFSMASRLEKTA